MHDYELYGYSLFETLAAKRGNFWRLRNHWARLSRSARRFGFGDVGWPEFVAAVSSAHDCARDEVLRVTLLKRGGHWSQGEPSVELRVLKLPLVPATPGEIRLRIAEQPLPEGDELRCYKTGSRLFYQHLLEQAMKDGFDNCLLYDTESTVLETVHHNLFFLREGRWITPPLSLGVLPGIARSWLLEQGLAEEEPLRLDQLAPLEAVLAGNSVIGLLPVTRIGDRIFSTEPALRLIRKAGPRHYESLSSGDE